MGGRGRRVPTPLSESERPGGRDAGAPTRALLCRGAPACTPTLLWLRPVGARGGIVGVPEAAGWTSLLLHRAGEGDGDGA